MNRQEQLQNRLKEIGDEFGQTRDQLAGIERPQRDQMISHLRMLMDEAGLTEDQLARNLFAKLPETDRKPYNHYRKWVRRLCRDGLERVDQRTRPLLEHVAELLDVSSVPMLWGERSAPYTWDRKLLRLLNNYQLETLGEEQQQVFISNRDRLLQMIEAGSLFIERRGKTQPEQKTQIMKMHEDLRDIFLPKLESEGPSWADCPVPTEKQPAGETLSPFSPEESKEIRTQILNVTRAMQEMRSDMEMWDTLIEEHDLPTIFRLVIRALGAERDVGWIHQQLLKVVAGNEELD